ncbi:MAG: hypothetical protein P8X48_11080 [Acidiferrobacteraceae bacterium]
MNEALRKTSESLGRNRRDWIMAESEQLMIVANQRPCFLYERSW